jgi:hypothetical protein
MNTLYVIDLLGKFKKLTIRLNHIVLEIAEIEHFLTWA